MAHPCAATGLEPLLRPQTAAPNSTRIDVCSLPNVTSLDNTASNQQSEVLCGALQRAHARESRMKGGGGLCWPLCGHKSQGSKPGNPCDANCESATLAAQGKDAQVRQRIHRTILQGQHVKKARRGSAGRAPWISTTGTRHGQVPGNRVRDTRGRHMRQRHALYAGGLAAKVMTKLRRATAPTRLAGRVGKATAKRPHHAREHGTGSTAYGASSAGVSGHVPAVKLQRKKVRGPCLERMPSVMAPCKSYTLPRQHIHSCEHLGAPSVMVSPPPRFQPRASASPARRTRASPCTRCALAASILARATAADRGATGDPPDFARA